MNSEKSDKENDLPSGKFCLLDKLSNASGSNANVTPVKRSLTNRMVDKLDKENSMLTPEKMLDDAQLVEDDN